MTESDSEKTTYTVTFNSNGGSGTIASISAEEGSEITLPENTFTKDSYIFIGWTISADGDISYADKAKITVTDNLILYAKWGMTATNAITAIAGLTEEGTHTVTVVGEISANDKTKLTDVISGLVEDVNIILDLSDTTGLTEIDEEFNLENLAGLMIPASVTEIPCTFWKNLNLSVLKVADDNPVYKSVGNIIYTKDGQMLVLAAKNLTEATIPASVKTIRKSAFKSNHNLKKITFENRSILETIENDAFSSCIELSEITLPSTVRTLGEDSFSYCYALKSIALPEGVKTIPAFTFYDCTSLTEISLPSTLESIKARAFRSNIMDISTINYNGTMTDWNMLKDKIGEDNDAILNATIHCTDGVINGK